VHNKTYVDVCLHKLKLINIKTKVTASFDDELVKEITLVQLQNVNESQIELK